MKIFRQFLVWAALGLAALPARAIISASVNAPGSVYAGENYTVTANGSDDMGQLYSLTLTRNGQYMSTVYGSGWSTWNLSTSIYETTTPGGGTSISYGAIADTFDYTATGWATVSVQANGAPYGWLDTFPSVITQPATFTLSGWAVDPDTGTPVTSANIRIDGNSVGWANLGEYRSDVANAVGHPTWVTGGYSWSYSSSSLAPGTHTIEVWAYDSHGVSGKMWQNATTFTVNRVPVVNSASASNINATGTTTVSWSASDPDGNFNHVDVWITRWGSPYWDYLGSFGATGSTTWQSSAHFNSANAGSDYVFVVRAVDNYNTYTDANPTFIVSPLSQTISFTNPGTQTYSPSLSIPLSVSASSSLPVDLAIVSGSASMSGNTVLVSGAGTITIMASQGGNSTWAAAPNVTQSFTVNKANQTISFSGIPTHTYGDSPFVLSASASSGLGVSFSVASGPATVSGNTLTITGAGIVTVTASQAGNANYNAASANQSFTVNKANQTISFGALSAHTYGDSSFTLSASASSGLGVSFTVASGPAAISGNTLTITGAGTVTVTASQAGNTNYNAASSVNQSFTVNKASATVTLGSLSATYDGSPHAATATTSPAGLPVTFTYNGSSTTPTNAATYAVVGTINHANYTGSATGSLVINPQAVSLSASGTTFTYNGSAQGPTVTPAGVFSVTGTATATNAGSYSFTATPTSNYSGAPLACSWTIAKASQTITVSPASKTLATGASVSLTASGGQTGSYTWGGDATGTGATKSVSFATAGSYNVTVQDPGNGNYLPSNTANAILTILPADWPSLGTDPSASDPVGTTGGSLSVDKSGAATYSVPIWVTPGTAGMQPQVALSYSSQAGNGIAGYGWSLSGASVITRGGQTVPEDGAATTVSFTASDRFYLDGQRLMAISGTDGANGTEYRTQLESFTKVISYGSAGSGPAYFKAWTKAGLIIEFGNTTDSAFKAQGRNEVMRWHVNKISDTKGNYMAFVYEADTTGGLWEQRLSRINYTGNGGVAPYASLRFGYETRPDIASGYLKGSQSTATKRLKTIKAYYGETVVRTYTLNFTQRANTSRTLLTSIVESASDAREYEPLTFEYEQADTGWQELGESGGPPALLAERSGDPKGTGFVDLDGDGRPDFVQYQKDGNGVTLARGAWLNDPVGGWVAADGTNSRPDYRPPAPLAFGTNGDCGMRFVDVNLDGLADFIDLASGRVYLNSPTLGWVESMTWRFPTPVLQGTELSDLQDQIRTGENMMPNEPVNITDYTYALSLGSFVDVNNDGRPDFIGYRGQYSVTWNNIHTYSLTVPDAWLNTGAGWTRAQQYGGMSAYLEGTRFADVNGDGRPDSIQYWYGNNTTKQSVYLGTSTGWAAGTFATYGPPLMLAAGTAGSDNAPVGTEAVDLNGDGIVDLVQNDGSQSKVALGTGDGWTAVSTSSPFLSPYTLASSNIPQGVAFIDVNSDGIVDLVKAWDVSTRAVRLGTGSGWSAEITGASASTYNLVRQIGNTNLPSVGSDFVDLNADGAVDQVWHWKESGSTVRGAALNKSKPADRLKKVTNGLGVAAEIVYAPLTERDATTGAFTVFTKGPIGGSEPADTSPVIGPMYVVKTVKHDDGAGGQYPVDYFYGNLRTHRLRGSQGFGWMRTTDGRTHIQTTTWFRQEFPYTGMPKLTETKTQLGATLSQSITTWSEKSLNSGQSHFPYASEVIAQSYELSATATTGALVTESSTTTQYDNWGNATQVAVDSLDGYTKTTDSVYGEDSVTNWFLGRLTESTVTATAPGKPTLTRKSTFSYESGTGLLKQEIVEPNDLALKLITDYEYDDFGNKKKVALSGNGVTSRVTQTTYDSQGRFPASSKNALNQEETYVYDANLGVMTSLTGPNNLTTLWAYDSFGNKVHESRADGTSTHIAIKWAPSGAPSNTSYVVYTTASGTAPTLEYHDSFGRTFLTLNIKGDGQTTFGEVVYDEYGRPAQKFLPYLNGERAYMAAHYLYTLTSYDLLGRPTAVQTPGEVLDSVLNTTFSYQGLTTEATDVQGRVSRTVKNSQGWVTQSIRDVEGLAATVTYTYDAFGNLLTTNAAGVTTTLSYDVRGRKTGMVDPDMGTWSYSYNVFGELVSQTDAKSQTTTMAYDVLGRLTSRVETEGTTTWTYDTAANGIGKLASVSAPGGYSETYTYDSLGRPTAVSRTIDSTAYSMGQTYDAYGRPEKTVYPTAFQTTNVYNSFGFLKQVRRADSGHNDLYWQADTYAPDGRIDGETWGNGLTGDRIYSRSTGRLQTATIGLAPATGIQYLQYTYDEVGNVLTRSDGVIGRNETFGYDSLDRLTSHQIGTATAVTMGYDAKGNITSKSDAGTYAYTGTGPHAVSGVSGGSLGTQAYLYDDNGNMVSGGGRNITWTSFNQVKRVQNTANTIYSEFSFGAAHERVKQVSNLSTTLYVGTLWEKVTIGSSVVEKNYVFAPTGRVAVVNFGTGQPVAGKVEYIHTDALGSITAVTNELGQIEARFAYDGWGKRFGVDLNTYATALVSSTTNSGFTRGFTDHEHLDDLGLIHMNGRVYDPVLGRFLSADPTVDGAADSQGYNRYSYVQNNPVTLIDPTGYRSLGDVLKQSLFLGPHIMSDPVYWASPGTFNQYYGTASAIGIQAVCYYYGVAPQYAGAIAGGYSAFANSLLNGGSVGESFRAGAVGAAVGFATGYATGAIGSQFDDLAKGTSGWQRAAIEVGRATAHGVVGGAVSEASGGDFRHGFYGSFAGSIGGSLAPSLRFADYTDRSLSAVAARTTFAAVVGGTASALGGGKFANGAMTAAFQHLFNQEAAALRQMFQGMTGYSSADEARAASAKGQVEADAQARQAKLATQYAAYGGALVVEKAAIIGEATRMFTGAAVADAGGSLKFMSDLGVADFIDNMGEAMDQWETGTPADGRIKTAAALLQFTGKISQHGASIMDFGVQQSQLGRSNLNLYFYGGWSGTFYPNHQ